VSAFVDAQLAELLAGEFGPVNWRTLQAADARHCWQRLRGWVDWFRAEFGYDHRVVPPCWYRHPALVHVLSALQDCWRAAYHPSNDAAGAAEFHRTLMQLEARLQEWAARTGCTADAHRPDVAATYPEDTQQWRRHVERDLAARREREMNAAIATAQRAFTTSPADAEPAPPEPTDPEHTDPEHTDPEQGEPA
jgi:hypothetical protein